MNTNSSRPGVYVLDETDMKKVGPGVSGGFIFGLVTCLAESVFIASAVVSTVNFCVDRDKRKAWWAMFMSNFSRQSTADLADQVGNNLAAVAGGGTASLTAGAAEAVLENPAVSDNDAYVKLITLMNGDFPKPASCNS